MTIATIARPVSSLITLKGKNKALREGAVMRIAPLSFVESLSRTESIANLRVAFGPSPDEALVAVGRIEWVIGRLASRLAAGDFPKDVKDNGDKLEYARSLVCEYAAPPKEGSKPRALKAGQKGRRTPAQQRAYMAALEAWSQVLAELGLGKAQTQKDRNDSKKGKRSTNENPVRGDGKGAKGGAPTHSELVAKPKAMTAADAMQFLVSQSVTLLGFANKNAKVLPTAYGAAVIAFHKAIGEAAREHEKTAADKAK